MKYLLAFILGFLLSGVWFGCHMLIRQYIFKKKLDKFEMFSPLLSAFVPAVIICLFFQIYPIHLLTLTDLKLWGVAFVTVGLTSIIILRGKKQREESREPLYKKCVEAALMEVPQRVMMQTFICGLLLFWGEDTSWCILINAIIWCMDILVQAFIFKHGNYKKIMIEVVASFVFSIGAGYVFWKSVCFVIPMISHAAERYITNKKWSDLI